MYPGSSYIFLHIIFQTGQDGIQKYPNSIARFSSLCFLTLILSNTSVCDPSPQVGFLHGSKEHE